MKKNFFVGQSKKTFVQEIKNAFDSIYTVSNNTPNKEFDFWIDTSINNTSKNEGLVFGEYNGEELVFERDTNINRNELVFENK